MSNPEPIELDVVVKDEASEPLDKIAAKTADLEKSTATVPVQTEGVPQATEDMDSLEFMKRHMSENPAVLALQTDFTEARADLDEAEAHLGRVREKFAGIGQGLQQLGLGDIARQTSPIAGNLMDAAGAAASFGGPMAAAAPLALIAATGAAAIKKNMQEAAEVKALNVQNVKDFTQALRDGSSAAETLKDRLEKTGEIKVATLIDGVKDITPALAKAGVTVDQFTAAAGGGKDGIDHLGAALKAAGVPAKEAIVVLEGAVAVGQNMKEANERAAAVTKVLGDTQAAAGDQAAGAAGKQDALAGATAGAGAAAAGATGQVGGYVAALATIPPAKRTEIQAAIASGDIARANAALDGLTNEQRTAIINVTLHPVGFGATLGAALGAAARSVGGTVVTVNLPAGARGVDALREVTRAARRTGTRYGSAAVSRARR